MHILGFIIGHFLLVWVVVFFFFPQWLDVFIIPERRDDWKQPIAPGVLRDTTEGVMADGMETGSSEKKLDGRPHGDLRRENSDTIDGSSSPGERSDIAEERMRRDDVAADSKGVM
jgi:solute carrier family 6 GABA transporter-like protein 1